MKILVLMAGEGDAFREAGFAYPKNLVEIDGLPLIQRVITALEPLRGEAGETQRGNPRNRFLFLVPEAENRQYHTAEVIRLLMPEADVREVRQPTAGAACTALLAIDEIDADAPLLIINGDQILHADLGAITDSFRERGVDGGIVTFEAVHPRWSYVRCDADGFVVEAAEKRPISSHATAGVYYFARASDFLSGAMQMILKDAHVGGAYYICPVYNELTLRRGRIVTHSVPRESYFSLATPRGALDYEEHLRGRTSNHAEAFLMRCERLEDMTRGWFVGAFEPTAFHTDVVEVGIRRYAAGDAEARHYHRIATEITVVISGEVEMNGVRYGPGAMIIIEPGEATDFRAVTDAVNAVVKLPGALNDKYLSTPETPSVTGADSSAEKSSPEESPREEPPAEQNSLTERTA